MTRGGFTIQAHLTASLSAKARACASAAGRSPTLCVCLMLVASGWRVHAGPANNHDNVCLDRWYLDCKISTSCKQGVGCTACADGTFMDPELNSDGLRECVPLGAALQGRSKYWPWTIHGMLTLVLIVADVPRATITLVLHAPSATPREGAPAALPRMTAVSRSSC